MIKKPRPYGSIKPNSKVISQGDQTLVKISKKNCHRKSQIAIKIIHCYSKNTRVIPAQMGNFFGDPPEIAPKASGWLRGAITR